MLLTLKDFLLEKVAEEKENWLISKNDH